MGILNQPETATKSTPASTPAFETEDETMDTPTAEVQEQATTAIAAAKSTAVAAATQTRARPVAFQAQHWAFSESDAAGLSQSAPRIKGEQGSAYILEKELGKKFRFLVESWNDRKLISAGLDSKDPGYQEAMQYLRTSYDLETIHDDGRTIDEYLEYLKSLGYDKAKASNYTDIWGFVTWTDKDGEVAPDKWEIHLLQASQTSQGAFKGFCATQGLLFDRGVIPALPEEVEVHAMARSKGTMKYTNFAFVAVKK